MLVVYRFSQFIHTGTVRRRLRARHLRARRPYRGPVLTSRHRQQRLLWCRRHLNWTRRQWGDVLFTECPSWMFTWRAAGSVFGGGEANVLLIADLTKWPMGWWKCVCLGRGDIRYANPACHSEWTCQCADIPESSAQSSCASIYPAARRSLATGQCEGAYCQSYTTVPSSS